MLQELLRGGERVAWGAKTIPEGGFLSLPKRLHAPGLLICGDGAGLVNVPALKGIHYAVESGRLAAEAAVLGAAARREPGPARRPGRLRPGVAGELRLERPQAGAQHAARHSAAASWLGGALAGAMTATRGAFPPGERADGAPTPSRS